MKRILLLFVILSVSVLTTACINNLAVQELNNKAVAYMDKGDAQTAVCRLKSSLDLDDEVFQTHYNLAVAYNSLGQYEDAISEIKRVLELNPDYADAFYTLAVSKEALAYKVIEDVEQASGPDALSVEQIEEFNNKAEEIIEDYNKYLVMKPDASDTVAVNEKISELNSKIKEYTAIFDSKRKAEVSDSETNTEEVIENYDTSAQNENSESSDAE